jgi:hypothetical protein
VLYDIGYLDNDSLVDMIGNRNGTWPYPLYVYESPTYNSHPTELVWQDSMFMNITDTYITDLDQDGHKEIIFGYYDSIPLVCIYENSGDNQYSAVWIDTFRSVGDVVHNDFDLDGSLEFFTGIGGSPGGLVWGWECIGDNAYQLIFTDTLPWSNNFDVFSAKDMDGNGKPEFLFTSVHYAIGKAWLYLYESAGNNNYDYFLIDSATNIPGAMIYQRSVCGDIDADGKDEIIWSTFYQWHTYKAVGTNQFQKMYSSVWTTHDVATMSVCDLNGNGYPEVIESWEENTIPYSHATIIWEIEGVRLHQPNGGEVLNPGQQYPITWEKFDPPGADSFALFYSIDNGFNYDTIMTGLSSDDTSYLWTVPNMISDSCKIMIWAYGPPRSGEQEPRGTAWDFSDNVFAIREMGIETGYRQQVTGNSLKVLQNPTKSSSVHIQFSISQTSRITLKVYNSLGQLIEILADGNYDAGCFDAKLTQPISGGVYFLRYEFEDRSLVEKLILLK